MSRWRAFLRLEWASLKANGFQVFQALMTFLLLLFLLTAPGHFPPASLSALFVGFLLWVALSQAPSIFHEDMQQGFVGLHCGPGLSARTYALLKILSFWVFFMGPFLILIPFLSLLMSVSFTLQYCLCLAVASLSLAFMTALGSALTAHVSDASALTPLLLAPLLLPLLLNLAETPSLQAQAGLLAFYAALTLGVLPSLLKGETP